MLYRRTKKEKEKRIDYKEKENILELNPFLGTRTSRASSSSKARPHPGDVEVLAQMNWLYSPTFRCQNCGLKNP